MNTNAHKLYLKVFVLICAYLWKKQFGEFETFVEKN